MPALAAVPWLIPLITGVTAAGTLGEGIYSATQGGGSAPAGPTPAQQQAQQAAQTLAQQKAAFLSNNAAATTPATGTSGLSGPSTGGGGTDATSSSLPAPSPIDLTALLKLINPTGNPVLSGGTGSSAPPGVSNGLTSLQLG